MANDILVLADHLGGQLSDTTLELVGKARELAGATGGQVMVALLGAPDLAGRIAGADTVLSVDHPALVGIVATAQVYGGKLLAEVAITGDRGVCTVVAGSFPAAAGGGSPTVETVSPPAGLDDLKTSFLTMVEPEGGDVDITAAELLVSVGRGIGSQDNLEEVQELADALGAPLSASRPVTDAGLLPKTRQVGKSGLKVKPKVYLTFGISGAPEHLEGMRDAELIIACNTDAAAPIFDVAHYGTTIDLFDLVPALTDKAG